MKFKLIYSVFALSFLISPILLGQTYRTQAISNEIHSIEVQVNGLWNSFPVISLNTGDQIHIDFDQISDYLSASLRYKIVGCNADWTINNQLSAVEFLDGFDDNLIEDYTNSVNTTISYTHYSLKIPNRDIAPKLAGNYAVLIYDEDEGQDQILLTACFSVLDSQVKIAPTVSSITDIDANNRHHQLAFDLNYTFPIRDIQRELKVFVRQNNRLDNERKNLAPTFTTTSKLSYVHNRSLIFEAGNEYHRFETSSRRSRGRNVEQIEYKNLNYHIHLIPNRMNENGSYNYDQDQNGRVIYRTLDAEQTANEADYFYTHFYLRADNPIDEDIYINGAFTNNTFSQDYKLKYYPDDKMYHLPLLLKQGIYNYQYLAQKKDGSFSTEKVDGNFHETENEYSIYVYYRPSGQRYDKLIGFTSIQSRNK